MQFHHFDTYIEENNMAKKFSLKIFLLIFALANIQVVELQEFDGLIDYVPQVVQDQKHRGLFDELVNFGRNYANSIHMLKRTREHKHLPKDLEPLAPFTLLPSKFPRKLFDQAMAVQPAMNLLYFRGSLDHKFLATALEEVAKSDEMVRTLVDIMQEVDKEGGYQRQPISVNIQRADYMLNIVKNAENNDSHELKQIEVNVGAPGGGPMAPRMTKVHRKMLAKVGMNSSLEVLRDNRPYKTLAEAMYLAWLQFGDPKAIMVMVMGRGYLETAALVLPWGLDLYKEIERASSGQLKYVRMSVELCEKRLKLDDDMNLWLDDGRKVGLVYYRAIPTLTDEFGWKARRMMERSNAIKAPTIGLELMGMKKVQQVLAGPNVVEQFFPNPEEAHYVQAIRAVFTGLWSLDQDDEDTSKVIEDAIAHPDGYVLKPMKEGGGNNFFGKDVAEKLQQFTPDERRAHILMQRINPPTFQNYLIKPFHEPKMGEMVTEFSTFGSLVGNATSGTVLYNRGDGYLMRSKWKDSNEGGIIYGTGAYDSPYLY